jgi:hypothetical protein
MDMGPSDGDERALMRRVLAESMEDGAFGVAYALIYPPDAYADTDELDRTSAAPWRPTAACTSPICAASPTASSKRWRRR